MNASSWSGIPSLATESVRELRMLKDVSPIVRHHHERTDGTGYPDHLSGDSVPLLAQIMSIVDIYDALTTKRPYKAAFPADVACAMLRDEARRGWKSRPPRGRVRVNRARSDARRCRTVMTTPPEFPRPPESPTPALRSSTAATRLRPRSGAQISRLLSDR